jgi:hypothetical protein
MNPSAPIHDAIPRRAARARWLVLPVLGLLLAASTGCVSNGISRAPLRTTIETKTAVLSARVVSNFFLIEARQDDGRTYRFLIDTGSSATLVSTQLANALKLKERKPARTVRVTGSQGGGADLPAVTLKRLVLGDAAFERVPALVYDFTDLSSHLGLTIDGVIGFPVFRDTLLTLDYLGARLVIAPHPVVPPAAPRPSGHASTLAFSNERRTPLIPLQMGNESFFVLIDSGSDGGLSLNPAGLHPRFLNGPRAGTLIAALGGDRRQMVGRLTLNVYLGTHTVRQPITDLTDQLSAIGGELLRHFTLTFDQRRNLVTFARPDDDDVLMAPRRSTGLSFGRSAAYWRVLNVVPDTPTAQLPVQVGDLCTRINGEPVMKWDADRYNALLKSAPKVTYTFLNGPKETDLEVPVFELVP